MYYNRISAVTWFVTALRLNVFLSFLLYLDVALVLPFVYSVLQYLYRLFFFSISKSYSEMFLILSRMLPVLSLIVSRGYSNKDCLPVITFKLRSSECAKAIKARALGKGAHCSVST